LCDSFRICHRGLTLPSSREFEVLTDRVNLRKLFTKALEELRAMFLRIPCNNTKHVIDRYPGWAFGCLADALHRVIIQLCHGDHEIWDVLQHGWSGPRASCARVGRAEHCFLLSLLHQLLAEMNAQRAPDRKCIPRACCVHCPADLLGLIGKGCPPRTLGVRCLNTVAFRPQWRGRDRLAD
jgi:hypothetical protein